MTQLVKLTGKAMWAQVWEGQIDREYEDPDNGKGGNWKITLELDEANLKLYNALGTKSKAKDGKVTLRRYEYANFGNGPEALGAPKVIGVDEGTSIGNGSDVAATFEAYPYTFKGRPGTAVRLVSVEVLNLVPYEKAERKILSVDEAPPVH